MIESLYSNSSAMRTFESKIGVTANNIANVESQGFKKTRALMQEGSNGNVTAELERIDTQGFISSISQNGQIVEAELSNVDIVQEITETIPTQNGYEANAKVITSKDDMAGIIIDMIG